MTVLGPQGQCSGEEYTRLREQRINESQLVNDQLYALYTKLGSPVVEALRLAVKTHVAQKVGSAIVNITVLDQDLQPWHYNRGQMADGIWQAAPDDPFDIILPSGRRIPIYEGFIVDYDEGLGMPTMAAVEQYQSPHELVGI